MKIHSKEYVIPFNALLNPLDTISNHLAVHKAPLLNICGNNNLPDICYLLTLLSGLLILL